MSEHRPPSMLGGLSPAALALLLLALGLFPRATEAQATIDVIPETVALPTEGAVDVLVLFHNSTETPAQDVHLSTLIHAGVRVLVRKPERNAVSPQGTLAWQLTLSPTNEGPLPGTIHLRIDYVQVGTETPIPSVKTAALEVNRSTLDVQVQVETTLESLKEYRPGIVYLMTKNTSSVPIRVTGVEPIGPDFLTFRRRDSTDVTIGPNETHALAYSVSAPDRVQTGKHLLGFRVAFDHAGKARTWTGSTIVTHEVEVGILGESEILTALGVPSFLFLPGFLILITLGFLWEKEVLREKTEDGSAFPLEAKSAEFWVAAVLLSILVALVYPVVTGWLGTSVNYLEGYGLTDVVRVWSASVLVTCTGYVVFIAGRNGWQKWKVWRRQKKTPSADDSPVQMLRKLDKQGLPLHLRRVEVLVNGQSQNAFVLEPRTQDQDHLWVAPSIVYRWTEAADAAFVDDVNDAQDKEGDPHKLAELFEKGVRQKMVTVEWGPIGQLTHPHRVSVTDIQGDKDPRTIVQPGD